MYWVYEYLLLEACVITEQIAANRCRIFILWKNELKNFLKCRSCRGMFQWKRELSFSSRCFYVIGKAIKVTVIEALALFSDLFQVLASNPFAIFAIYIHALNLCPMLKFLFFWIVTGNSTRRHDFQAWNSSCKSAALF